MEVVLVFFAEPMTEFENRDLQTTLGNVLDHSMLRGDDNGIFAEPTTEPKPVPSFVVQPLAFASDLTEHCKYRGRHGSMIDGSNNAFNLSSALPNFEDVDDIFVDSLVNLEEVLNFLLNASMCRAAQNQSGHRTSLLCQSTGEVNASSANCGLRSIFTDRSGNLSIPVETADQFENLASPVMIADQSDRLSVPEDDHYWEFFERNDPQSSDVSARGGIALCDLCLESSQTHMAASASGMSRDSTFENGVEYSMFRGDCTGVFAEPMTEFKLAGNFLAESLTLASNLTPNYKSTELSESMMDDSSNKAFVLPNILPDSDEVDDLFFDPLVKLETVSNILRNESLHRNAQNKSGHKTSLLCQFAGEVNASSINCGTLPNIFTHRSGNLSMLMETAEQFENLSSPGMIADQSDSLSVPEGDHYWEFFESDHDSQDLDVSALDDNY